MRQRVKNFVKIVAETLPVEEPIFEFGSLQVPEQKDFGDLRPLFPGKEYVGADIRKGSGVDRILDLHNIDLLANSVGTVLCVDTLEHVEYPHAALEEIHRILKPGGLVVITSVMNFKIHGHPKDFWRFTPEGFRSLLKPFASAFVGFSGEESFPHTVVGLGWRGNAPSMKAFIKCYYKWKER